MMKVIKKTVSLCLVLCLVLLLLLELGLALGVSVSSAGYTSELWLMVGNNYMMQNGTRKIINSSVPTAAPYFYQGTTQTVYVPLAAVSSYFGGSYSVSDKTVSVTLSGGTVCTLTVGSTAWKKGNASGTEFLLPVVEKDGEIYISNATVKSVYGSSVNSFINHDTGLIVYSKAALSYSASHTSLESQIADLDGLLFDLPSADKVYSDLQKTVGDATAHPRLLINQARFDEIRAVYTKEGNLSEDEITFKNYINRVMSTANSYFLRTFAEKEGGGADWKDEASKTYYRQPYYLYDENGKRLYGVSEYEMPDGTVVKLTEYWQEVYPWQQSSAHGEGYDVGGRSNLDLISTYLKFFAFAWQMTGEAKWVDAFYMVATEISKWEHWGEGHFLDCADGAVEYALGFDWIYNAFSGTAEGKAKLREMAETLFVLGVEVGYNAMNNTKTYTSKITNPTNTNLNARNQKGKLHSSTIMGSNWKFHWTNNWQTVCTSGMIISALAVIEYEDMREVCKTTVSTMLSRINECLAQYAPDGSYIESAGYWEYSTKTFMFTIAAIRSSLGSDYGLLSTVGLHGSYYFATYIVDANFYAWSYHDGGRSRVGCSTFYLASSLFNDPNIAMARDIMLESGSIKADIVDVLFFDPTLSEGGSRDKLDYFGKNIDTVTMRSGWDKDAIFTGLHAGANSVAHGDIDSGNFYLVSGNTVWFGDRGGENYNVANFKNEANNDYFNGRYRYLYYKKSIVAHNSVFLISDELPRGQVFNSMADNYARITTYESDSLGGIAIADMTPQFNKKNDKTYAICSSAKRGLLFTNSRSTVVIQDEMTFNKPTTLVWSAETDYLQSMSEDGKTAYLRTVQSGKQVTMRVTLVSDDPSLKFTLVTDKTETFITYNDVTDGLYTSTKNGGQIVTKTNSQNELASDPYDRLTVQLKDVTELKMAIVCELIDDNREVVGYTMTDMDEWKTTSDAWVKDADQWIIDEGKIEYKYTNSDLMKAMSRYDAATTDAERFVIARELYDIVRGVDPSLTGVAERIKLCNTYISKFNVTRGKINKSFEEDFFATMKTVLGME